MRAAVVTQQEADEIGVNREVMQDWADVMQALWSASIAFFGLMGEDQRVYPVQRENEIFIGESYKICTNIVNNSYLETNLYKNDTRLIEIRYCGDVNIVCKCIGLILKNEIA